MAEEEPTEDAGVLKFGVDFTGEDGEFKEGMDPLMTSEAMVLLQHLNDMRAESDPGYKKIYRRSRIEVIEDHRVEQRKLQLRVCGEFTRRVPRPQASESFNSTLEYCQRFGQFGSAEKVKEVRALLSEPVDDGAERLRKYEIAQLGNLCPSDALEAKALIPSLTEMVMEEDGMQGAKFDDEDLDTYIETMKSLRNPLDQ